MSDRFDISNEAIKEEVNDLIILKHLRKKVRENWDVLFKEANKKNRSREADLFEGITTKFDIKEW